MTLRLEVPRVSFVADGAQTVFATGFTFERAEEVTVWYGAPTVTDCCTAPAYDNLAVLNDDYTIDAGDWLTAGGNVRFTTAGKPTAGQLVTLMRTTPADQPEGFGDLEKFTPEQHEKTLDRLTRMIQELYNNPLGFLLIGGLAHAHRFYTPDDWTDTTPIDVFNYAVPVTYPSDLLGSVFTVEAYDGAAKVISIRNKAAAEIGTLTIPATSGALTVALTALSLAAGEQMRFVPPAGGLGAVRGLAGTILGKVG